MRLEVFDNDEMYTLNPRWKQSLLANSTLLRYVSVNIPQLFSVDYSLFFFVCFLNTLEAMPRRTLKGALIREMNYTFILHTKKTENQNFKEHINAQKSGNFPRPHSSMLS